MVADSPGVAIQQTKPSKLVNAADIIYPAIGDNSVVSAAIQVLEQISEVGKVLPLVAPAFVLLKIIIDLEKRAADTDIKCNDLVERITFMLSHIPLIQNMDITPAINTVVERINEALKDSAALIAAYRKQGRIARRLRISYRDKFNSCVTLLSACCSDLLLTLQIRQISQLDILTRAVPQDAEDTAAENFVSSHGGSLEVIVHDRDLVKEFAQEQKLTMDDLAMEQLRTNIAETIKHNHDRLESILRDNVSNSILDGFKSLSIEALTSESEHKFTCVQCEKEFTARSNGTEACTFHRSHLKSSWTNAYECCGTAFPCESGPHRAIHHSDYPYSTFFSRFRFIDSHQGCLDKWAEIRDTDLEESGRSEYACVGRLVSWTGNLSVEANTIFVTVGTVWHQKQYYFDTFTVAKFQEINESVRITGKHIIFRNSLDLDAYSMAEWILSDCGNINGIRISTKAATSAKPHVLVCPIDITTATKNAPVTTVSKGGLRAFTPASPYILPESIHIGPELKETNVRPVRNDFKTITSDPSFRIIMRTMSDPPLSANMNTTPFTVDIFHGTVSAFNNNDEGSLKSITIVSVSAKYRMVGEPDYNPVQQMLLLDGLDSRLPVTLPPRQSAQIKFEVKVPRTDDDAKLRIPSRGLAFLARCRPLRLKLTLEDIEGNKSTLVLEYVCNPNIKGQIVQPTAENLAQCFFDNHDTLSRYYVSVSRAGLNSTWPLTINGVKYDATRLEKLVYSALKTGTTEFNLGIGRNGSGKWEAAAYALVDTSCQRVYAFKIFLHDGENLPRRRFGAVYYIPCPKYGDNDEETRPISYAKEMATLPPLEPYSLPIYVQDDNYDDVKPQTAPTDSLPSSTLPCGSAAGGQCFADLLSRRLDSIDSGLANLAAIGPTLTLINANLDRIALAFERLASKLP